MALPPIVGLEIGTHRIVALVGEQDAEGRVTIVGMGTTPTTGVRKGEIVSLGNVRFGIAECIRQAEASADAKIHEVYLGVTGAHLRTCRHRGMAPVRGHNRTVAREDIEEVLESAESVNLADSQEVLHTICRQFALDDQEGILNPEGMRGAQLAVDVLVVHGARNRLENAANAVRGLSLKVVDTAFTGICAAMAVLTPEQRRAGVILIDLGAGTTDYLAYVDNKIELAGTLALGGDHLTNDVALAFQISSKSAEALKCTQGSALMTLAGGAKRAQVPADVPGFAAREVSLKALHCVLNARADEILRCVYAQMEAAGLLSHIGAGVVITGGGACLNGMPELVQHVFGLPCGIGLPVHVEGLRDAPSPTTFASAAGLVCYGFKAHEQSSLFSPLRNWFRGVLGR